jgi:hypothetical protein
MGDSWFVGSKQVAFVGAEEEGRPFCAYVVDLSGGEPHALSPEEISGMLGPTVEGDLITVTPRGGLRRQPLAGGPSRDLGLSLPDRDPSPLRWFGIPARIERLDLKTGRRTPWKTLMPDDPAGVTLLSQIAIADDGESYAYTYGRFLQDLFLVDGVR